MGKFKSAKPTRAEIKAQKKAAKEAARQAERDSRELAKEEKRAAKQSRSMFGFGRKKEEAPSEEADTDFDFGDAFAAKLADRSTDDKMASDVFAAPTKADRDSRAESGDDTKRPAQDDIIIDEDIRIIPANSRKAQELRAQPVSSPSPVARNIQPTATPSALRAGTPDQPRESKLMTFDFGTAEGRAMARKALEEAEAAAVREAEMAAAAAAQAREEEQRQILERQAQERQAQERQVQERQAQERQTKERQIMEAATQQSAGTLIRRKADEPHPAPRSETAVEPLTARGPRPPAPDAKQQETQRAVADSFAALRSAVDRNDDRGAIEPLRPTGQAAASDDVLLLDDPITNAPRATDPIPVAPEAFGAAEPEQAVRGFSENWVGLWVAEDGQAIFIEDDDDGWHAVTVLQDPTTKCFYGPDYPEIQTFRMPAVYAHEKIGDFEGERFSVITVPGLPDEHRSPIMYLYFLTSVPASQGGGNRFATPDDPTNRVFLVADFELGSVNPWSEDEDIDWIDPSVNFYKAPGKLDAYMSRRMANEDPLN